MTVELEIEKKNGILSIETNEHEENYSKHSMEYCLPVIVTASLLNSF